jgi:hypothetical protein
MLTKRQPGKLKSTDLGAYTLAEACILRANLMATIRQCRDRSLRPAARVQLRRVGLSIRFRRDAKGAPKERQANHLELLENLGFSADERQKLSR